MDQWGIFNDESADYTESEALEAGFYTLADADAALKECYSDDDCAHVHAVEEHEVDESNDGDDDGEPEIFLYY